MILTDYEEALLRGERGEAKRIAMRVLCALGETYGAERTIPVAAAHIDGCSYSAVWDAGLDFAEKLAEDGRVAVPTTLNITARDINKWREFGVSEEFAEKNRRMEEAYYKLGCIPTWTCAVYQYGESMPSFGEHVAFAESNVVNYVNSVIGARTERYGDLIDICCALVGRVPEIGFHVTENRRARYVFDVSGIPAEMLEDPAAFAALGHYVGDKTGSFVPAVTGLSFRATHEQLKAFSAASAASGSVALFHVVGSTPEAPDLETALQGGEPDHTEEIGEEKFREILAGMDKTGEQEENGRIDAVIVGCPHLSYSEISRLVSYMDGRRKADSTEFWVQTNDTVYSMMHRTDLYDRAKAAGIRFLRDACVLNQPTSQWGFRSVMTNSGKAAHYMPGILHANIYFGTMRECVEAAVRGRLGR